MKNCEAMTSSTHSFAYSYRLVKKCFLKICETSKCHSFLIFKPIFIRFSLFCSISFTPSSEIKLNLFWISSLAAPNRSFAFGYLAPINVLCICMYIVIHSLFQPIIIEGNVSWTWTWMMTVMVCNEETENEKTHHYPFPCIHYQLVCRKYMDFRKECFKFQVSSLFPHFHNSKSYNSNKIE